MDFEDILYEIRNGVAWITINRPDKMNAFRGTTCDELIRALNKAGYDRNVGCIVLAGAGDRAFCTGGDQSAHDGNYDGRGTIGLPMEELHTAIRDVPKPVIARAGEHDAADVAVVARLVQRLDQLVAGGAAERVHLVRTVDRDPGDAVADLVEDVVEVHVDDLLVDRWDQPFIVRPPDTLSTCPVT